MEGLTHEDVEHVPQEFEEEEDDRKEGEEEQEEQKQQTVYNSHACPMCGITLFSPYITHCTICNVKVPLGDTRKGMLRHEFQNRHLCNCGNKENFLLVEESTYYIWDMESLRTLLLYERRRIIRPP
jgi:hypothetical protein